MKKLMYVGSCLFASVALAAAAAVAQTTGSGAGAAAGTSAGAGAGAATQQDAQAGQAAGQQGTLQGQASGGVGTQPTQSSQLNQQGTLQQQGRIGTQAPLGIETQQRIQTRQDVAVPDADFVPRGRVDVQDEETLLRQDQGREGTATALNGDQRAELGVWLTASGGPGVEVRRITAGSAAELAGLQPGDVLLQVNGRPVMSPMEVQQLIRAVPVGEAVTLEILRDGVQQQVSATLAASRQPYRSAFRGDDMAANGDLMSRTMRLEQQLAMVIQELRVLREEMAQLRGSAPATTGVETRIEERQVVPGEDAFERQPAQEFDTAPAPLPAEPAPQPEAAPPETEEPAEAAEDDLFGTSATETETEITTPPATTETEAETETEAAETETETETDTDTDLFN